MSTSEQIFLGGNSPRGMRRAGNPLGLTFASEQDLDSELWMNPKEAPRSLRYLLRLNKGELTPTMSRLALKAVALPLFTREFEGDNVSETTETAVRKIGYNGSQLLGRYLDLRGDVSVDQAVLDQAITDATTLQLVSRSLRSKERDDVILLPIGHPMYKGLPNTEFTVLRRHELGRANLAVVEQAPKLYTQSPNARQQRILITPSEMIGPDASMGDIAELLVAEQDRESVMTYQDRATIDDATDRLLGKIDTHFSHIQPRS